MLFCIVGPSGSGKSTIVNKLCDLGYIACDSYTTRPKRYENETGHTFITEEEYDKLTDIVAHVKFNGYRYCVTVDMLEKCDLYIIDPLGLEVLRKHMDNFKVIGLSLSKDKCINRMLSRGDSQEDVDKRIENDKTFFDNFESSCDYVIDASKNLTDIVNEINEIMIKENVCAYIDKELAYIFKAYDRCNKEYEKIVSGDLKIHNDLLEGCVADKLGDLIQLITYTSEKSVGLQNLKAFLKNHTIEQALNVMVLPMIEVCKREIRKYTNTRDVLEEIDRTKRIVAKNINRLNNNVDVISQRDWFGNSYIKSKISNLEETFDIYTTISNMLNKVK